MRDMMLDIETLGTRPGCVVLSIGACMFDMEDGVYPEDGSDPDTNLYVRLDTYDQRSKGATTDPDTVKWHWANQTPEVDLFRDRSSTFSIASASQYFAKYYAMNRPRRLWCKGPDFDVAILRYLFESVDFGCWPAERNNPRDVRTILDIAETMCPGYTKTKKEVKHHALQDAIDQARDVVVAYKVINGCKRRPDRCY